MGYLLKGFERRVLLYNAAFVVTKERGGKEEEVKILFWLDKPCVCVCYFMLCYRLFKLAEPSIQT